jgi:hypothetical protein
MDTLYVIRHPLLANVYLSPSSSASLSAVLDKKGLLIQNPSELARRSEWGPKFHAIEIDDRATALEVCRIVGGVLDTIEFCPQFAIS